VNYRNPHLVLALSLAAVIVGCEQPARTSEVFAPYHMTTLKLSTSGDVLNTLAGMNEPVSQSGSVVASYGTAEKGTELWFNMIAFDEESSAAVRKYAILVDESTGVYIINPGRALRFDASVVVSASVLNEPYDSENSRAIAVLKVIRKDFDSDLGQIEFESVELRSGAMTAMKALNTLVQVLEDSPSKAAFLGRSEGLDFQLMNIGNARARMVQRGDVVTVKLKGGKSAEGFADHPDVRNM